MCSFLAFYFFLLFCVLYSMAVVTSECPPWESNGLMSAVLSAQAKEIKGRGFAL